MYDGITFAPYFSGRPLINPRFINMWMGYDYDASAPLDMALVEPLLSYLRDKWCREDERLYEYIINWFAYLIQEPGNPNRTAIILRDQACENTKIAQYIGKRIVGERYFCKCCIAHIGAQSDERFDMKTLVLADTTMEHTNIFQSTFGAKLERISTRETVVMRQKRNPMVRARNSLHFILGVQASTPFCVEPSEGKYCIVNCVDVPLEQRDAYFSDLLRVLETKEAVQSVFTFFATRDIRGFNVGNIPPFA
jgi:hypothetical protein